MKHDPLPVTAHESSTITCSVYVLQLSCMWEDVRWLRQSMSVSMSSASTLQARHKMLTAAAQLQDRHGNVLLVTIRDTEGQHSLFSGRWMQVTKLQSQRKSLSTPEEPYALDILIITMQVSLILSVSVCFYVQARHFRLYSQEVEKFISLYCRLSSVLDLDALITQQALREAITDGEVTTARSRHQLILDYIQVREPTTLLQLLSSMYMVNICSFSLDKVY
ncbi:hypothetical protein XENOCAPTIV_009448 [Xenoophorus captivus]|uniref:Uncharacterized protein n=1 Tax=Xenoophorus captivus TaxID=1517983 RepID=A0ABV0QZF1_9TELE